MSAPVSSAGTTLRLRLPATFLLILAAGIPLQAQEDASFSGFQFNRSLPGARSLGLGGAFVALANDATAAYSNPAGLTLLESPEVALEARHWDTATRYTARGDATVESDFLPSDFEIESTKSYTAGPSFASFVYAKPRARWAVAVYRHMLIDFQSRFSSFGVRKNEEEFFGPLDFSTDLKIVNFGVSGSFRISDSLRIGLGASFYDFQLRSRQIIRDPAFTLIAGKQGDDSAIDLNFGALWEINPVWTVGAAYRRGPGFEMNECFPAPGRPCFSGGERGERPGGFDVISEFHVPDQLALGIAFQPKDNLTFLFEYDRIEYSALLAGNRLGSFTVEGQRYGFSLEDADELRVGVEYLIPRSRGESISVMLGSWYDPDHTITFEGTGTRDSIRLRRAFFRPTGDDEIHLCAGLEANLGRYQVNLGVDHSDRIGILALSTVVRIE